MPGHSGCAKGRGLRGGGASLGRGLGEASEPPWGVAPKQSGLERMLGPTSLGTSSFLSRGPAPKRDQVAYSQYGDRTVPASTSSPGHVTTSLNCFLTQLTDSPSTFADPKWELPASRLGGEGGGRGRGCSLSLFAGALETCGA